MYILQHFSNIAAIYSLDQSSQYAMQLHYVLKLEKIFFNVPVFWVLEKAITNKKIFFCSQKYFSYFWTFRTQWQGKNCCFTWNILYRNMLTFDMDGHIESVFGRYFFFFYNMFSKPSQKWNCLSKQTMLWADSFLYVSSITKGVLL